MAKRPRIGILTAGGDCPGLNAVIRAVAKSAMHEYGMDVIGFEDGYYGLIKDRWHMLDNPSVSGILTQGGTILGTSNRDNVFAYYEENTSKPRDLSDAVVNRCKKMGLTALVTIGGDGTLTGAYKLAQKGLPVIGVPKTIDNDVWVTDQTFGFDSACSIATEAIDRLHTTAMSHHRIMIIELMGRNAGWLTLCSGIAGGGDVLLIPEIPYRLQSVCDAVIKRSRQGKRFSIICIAEGAKPVDGDVVVGAMEPTTTHGVRLGGVSQVLRDQIEECTGLEARNTILGHLQRGGSPTFYDRVLATQYGKAAADLAARGKINRVVALRGAKIIDVPLRQAAGKRRTIPLDHMLIATARAIGATFGE